jgi:hypothetical protein
MQITTPMEKLLKKEVKFQWNEDFQKGLDTLKQRLVTAPILVFPYWNKEFHVHVDASSIALGAVLSQPGEGAIDHLIAFASRKLSISEKKLYHYRMGRPGHGLCAPEVQTLPTWVSLQDVHRPFCIKILSQ